MKAELSMEELPKISVIIPTRDRPALLQRAIRSALQQTMREIEVIVVRDGEDAGTKTIVESLEDARLRLIELEIPVGGSEARNVGARAAHGKYIALLDDDDEWLATKLERQFAVAEKTTAVSLVVVTQYLYRIAGQCDELWPGHLPIAAEPLSEFLFSSRGGFQTSTYLCPRELMLSVPFTPGLKKHQDWDWFLRVAAEPGFELLIVDEPLSIYWAPEPNRTSVSTIRDWRFSRDWAKSRLNWMTKKAYARFLVKICTRQARQQHAGIRTFWELARELLLVGECSVSLFAEYLVAILLPETIRLWIRGLVFAKRSPRQKPYRRGRSFEEFKTSAQLEEGANACPR
jgi:glycosyltransferase involved in cell wall biosynthesis